MKLHAQFTVTPCTTRIIEEDDGSGLRNWNQEVNPELLDLLTLIWLTELLVRDLIDDFSFSI